MNPKPGMNKGTKKCNLQVNIFSLLKLQNESHTMVNAGTHERCQEDFSSILPKISTVTPSFPSFIKDQKGLMYMRSAP